MKFVRILLIRHGQTEWNVSERLQGWSDIPLTDEGVREAQKLADYLRNFPIDTIYTSPLQRALKTAEAIHAHHAHIPLIQRDDLRERSFGDLDGKTYKEVNTMSQALIYSNSWFYPSFRPSGGECLLDVQKRAAQIKHHIVENHPGQTVGLVGHAVILKCLLSVFTDLHLTAMGLVPMANTSVCILDFAEGKETVVHTVNLTRHLK